MTGSISPRGGRGRALVRFVAGLRWAAAAFGAVCVIGAVVLALRAPDCIAIGVSVLSAEDCTNRETYYLLLAAGVAIVTFLCMLVFACAYALELLGLMADGREGDGAETI